MMVNSLLFKVQALAMSGIERDRSMAEKFMIHKITPSVDYNWWFKRLDTQLNESTNQNIIKVFKVVNITNKKTLL